MRDPTFEPTQRAKALEQQQSFEPTSVFETEDGNLEIYESKPEQLADTTPVFIAPGFTQGPKTLESVITSMGENRHTVFPYLPTGRPSAIRERQLMGESEEQQGKAMTYIDAMEKLGIGKVDAVAHSEGCVNIMMAAALYPEKFRNIVLVNPSGLMGADNAAAKGMRFVGHKQDVAGRLKTNQEMADTDAVGKPERDGYFKKDLVGTLGTVVDLASIRLEEIMAVAKANGVKIAIIHTADDKLYPIERVLQMNERYREQLKLDEIEPNTSAEDSQAELIDKFYQYEGTHNDFYLKPQHYTVYAQKALADLQADRA